jgi:hypothetical protein
VQEQIYPQLYRYILHPCVSWPGNPNMCGNLHTATGCLRFDSFLTQDNVVIMLIYEVRSLVLPSNVLSLVIMIMAMILALTCCSSSIVPEQIERMSSPRHV